MSIKTSKYIIIVLSGIVAFFAVTKLIKCTESRKLIESEVVLIAKVQEDDVFQLFYWEKGEAKFKIENSVRAQIIGNTEFQEIRFKLPTLTSLNAIRLDIGENPNQQNVNIQSFEFKTDSEGHVFNKKEFSQLFSPNKYIRLNGDDEFTGISGGNDRKGFYDPYFISNNNSSQMVKIRGGTSISLIYLGALIASIVLMLFMFRNQERITISTKGVFVSIFVLILIIPTVQKQFSFITELESLEKRKLVEKPEFTFTHKFTKNFEAYLDDNFGFRNRLVSWGSKYKTELFRSSKNPDLSMFGKEKWLFYTRRIGNTRMYRSFTRTNLLSEDTLGLLVGEWEKRKEKYEASNRKYFLVYWPNKHTIYPEKMSSIMKTQVKDTISRIDQILNYINKTESSVNLIDVRSSLIKEKSNEQMYYKFDSHWNDYGAFVGYQSFFNQIQPKLGITSKKLQDFNIKWNDYYGGELIELSGVRNDGFFKDKRPYFTLKENKNQIEYLPVDGFPRLTLITKNEHAGNKLRALIFRDSFSNSLIQFFSLHFYEVYYIWGQHKEYYVNKLSPDIIIDGFVEREIGEHIN